MRSTVKLPKLGDTADEVVVVEWLVDVGAQVEQGTPLMLVETSKVNAEVPSPLAGTVVEQLATVDDELPIGAPICVLET